MPTQYKIRILALFLGLILFISGVAFAKEPLSIESPAEEKSSKSKDTVVIKASEEIIGSSDEIYLRGDVRIEGSDFIARGKDATVDLVNGIIDFKGGVSITQGEKHFTGSEMTYNYNTKTGTIKAVSGNIQNENFKKEVYLYGDEMSFESDYFILKGGKITSCDLIKPHYHIAADSIEIYENDRLILRNLYYKERNFPLFYFPYWRISLKAKDNYFKFPQIGSSANEGFYVKLTYVYKLNALNGGEIYLDYLKRLGLGQGLWHKFSTEKTDLEGRYYLVYDPFDSKLQSFETSGSFSTSIKDLDFLASGVYKNDYTQSLPKHQRALKMNGSYKTLNLNSTLKFSYDREYDLDLFNSGEEKLQLETANVIRLKKGWRLNLGAKGLRERKPENRWVNTLSYDQSLSYQGKNFLGTLRWQQEDKTKEENSSYKKLLRQPEMVLQTRGLKIWDFPITFESTAGRYMEQPGSVTSNKLSLRATAGNKTYKITPKLDFNLLGEVQATVYDLKTFDPHVLSGRTVLGLSYKPVQNWSFGTTYTKQNVSGNSPFSFDQVGEIHSLDFRLYNTFGFLSNEITTGYDLVHSRYKKLSSVQRLNFRFMSGSFEHSYTLVPFVPLEFTGSLNIKPNENIDLRAELSFGKKADSWVLKQLDSRGKLKFGDFILAGEATYDSRSRIYTTLKASLEKQFHCRSVSITYDRINRAIWLEFRIDALGEKPLKVKTSQTGIDFSADMLTLLGSGN